MKTLIAYFTYGGNTGMVAGLLKSALNADVHEIKLLNQRKRFGPGKFFWALSQVFGNKRPALKPHAVNINSYDLVILGTPVWAGFPSTPVFSFLDQTEIKGKKVALFCCHGGQPGQAMEKLKTAVGSGNTITGEIDFHNPAKSRTEELKKKVDDWVSTLI